ncbi:MAG: 16S rRNA processing protein RimM [Clostridia bacterium]|nr:16S rRNA processing protein RimM [Clostridia bacterium]
MKLEYLECGKILAAHGVRGAVRIEVWCDSPAIAAALPTLYFRQGVGPYTGRRLLHASVHKGGLLATLEGITSPEEVAPLRGVTVYARREDLDPRGERVFLAETVGLPVLHAEDGRLLGHVREVDTSRKTTLYIIETEGGEVMLPAVPEFVKEIDIERGMTVCPIPGFFDEV